MYSAYVYCICTTLYVVGKLCLGYDETSGTMYNNFGCFEKDLDNYVNLQAKRGMLDG